eukprot:TRINITY_DN1874_c1_g1_i1.p1 TRINITY_DN1874_c1_g1~~TRINITY_DN1874_c1_g1_i1.p1  ORF type:complete len:175 (-),score=17.33 TRINITY_DN1874_c1_g1_i1:46-570(-)
MNDNMFIFLFFPLKILFPIYFRGVSENILDISTSFETVGWVVFSILIQIFIIQIQRKCGSRFFLPPSFLPERHKYFVSVVIATPDGSPGEKDKCPVCMNDLDDDPSGQNAPLLPAGGFFGFERRNQSPMKSRKVKLMKTPCAHLFHIPCLKQWMRIKMECPTCQTALPEVVDQR